jgi:rod shape determining protein RodA
MFSRYFSFLKRFDWILAAAVFLLLVLSLVALYSISLSKSPPDFLSFEKQLIFIAIGLLAFLFFGAIDYKWLRFYSWAIYGLAALLLVAVLIFGRVIRGTQGWFGFGWFNFQPVEFAKLALIIFLAKYFSRGAHEIFNFKHIVTSGFFSAIFVGLVLLQPDFGSAIILFFLWIGSLFLIGIKRSHLLALLLLVAVLLAGSWFFVFQDYQKERILSFFDASRDPLGRGYNITQAQIAVGSGEMLGRGIGFGPQSQLRFVPESQTDFIFAVIAEELGFLGTMLVLGLWGIIFWRIVRLARRARDDFSLFLVAGTAIVFLIQIFVNIGMTVGVAPVTGISLPFLSYGGSALLINLAMIGILESVAGRNG